MDPGEEWAGEGSPSGARATQPPLHRGDLEEDNLNKKRGGGLQESYREWEDNTASSLLEHKTKLEKSNIRIKCSQN